MWVQENKISTIEGLLNSKSELESFFIQVVSDRSAPIPEFCPHCGQKPVNKRYDGVALTLKACPDGHGVWLTPKAAEKFQEFLKEGAGEFRPIRGRKIEHLRLVGIGIGIIAGLVSSYFKDNFKSSAVSPAKSKIISPKNWPSRDYTGWYPLPQNIAGMDSQEYTFWKEWCGIMESGITNRMNVQDGLDVLRQSNEYSLINSEYQRRQEVMLQQLASLPAPERLKHFKEIVLSAGYDQIQFYEEYTKARAASRNLKFQDFQNQPDLKAGDQKLWDAYHYFQAQYPAIDKATNDAIEQRLAWFDII